MQDLNLVPGGGDVPDPNDVQVCLDRLNDWIDGLALEGLTLPSIARVTWPLVAGTSSYTVGAGSTVNISKPVNPQSIQNIGYYESSLVPATEILFGATLTENDYQNIPQKSYQATAPTGFYYSPTTGLTGTLSPWPIPNISTLVGVIYAPTLLVEVTLNDTITLPRGYRRFFRSNLTEEIAAAFSVQVPPTIARAARSSRMRVKAVNVRMVDAQFDPMVPGVRGRPYSIWADQ